MYNSPKLYNETGFKKENDAKDFIISLKDKKAIVKEVKNQSKKKMLHFYLTWQKFKMNVQKDLK